MNALDGIPELWLGRGLAVVLIAVGAAILARLAGIIARRVTARVLRGPRDNGDAGRQRRREGLGRIAGWLAAGLVWSIALGAMFFALGIDLLAFVAGVGFLGVAIVTAAQNPLKDMVAGIMIVADDHIAPGDRVRIGDLEGTVERIDLRATHLRAEDGTPWFVSNQSIDRIAVLERREGPAPAD